MILSISYHFIDLLIVPHAVGKSSCFSNSSFTILTFYWDLHIFFMCSDLHIFSMFLNLPHFLELYIWPHQHLLC